MMLLSGLKLLILLNLIMFYLNLIVCTLDIVNIQQIFAIICLKNIRGI